MPNSKTMSNPNLQQADNSKLVMYKEYEIKKCVYWITFNKYQRTCLQFPDNLLNHSIDIALAIEKEVGQKVYILGDTSFSSCCVDYVAAKRIPADSVIHFGRGCLTSAEVLPTLYVFPKSGLDVKAFCNTIIDFTNKNEGISVILYDVSFSHLIDTIVCDLAVIRNQVRVSRLATPQQNTEVVKYSSSDVIITKLGRIFSLPSNVNKDQITFIYMSNRKNEKNLENFLCLYPGTVFYRYDSNRPGLLEKGLTPEIIKRRLYLVQKIKEAKRIGIVVSTLAADKFMEAIERVKTLCKLKNKKFHPLLFHEISPAKLANFPEISIFIMIACPETVIPVDRDYYQPIASMMEAEMALNDNDVLWENTIKDFREFLPGGEMYKEIKQSSMEVEGGTDVSLTNSSNKLLSNAVCDPDVPSLGDSAVVTRDASVVSQSSISEGLSGRSWQGLQLSIGDKPVEKANVGRSGTPSSGYQHPFCSHLQ